MAHILLDNEQRVSISSRCFVGI